MGVIFRKIGGRIVRIVVGSEKAARKGFTTSSRVVTAKAIAEDGTKKVVGRMKLDVPWHTPHADVASVQVEKEFRRKGISKKMFEHAQKLLGRSGKKFMRSYELMHPAQVGIRHRSGKSAFIGYGYGPYGEGAKKLKVRTAKETVKGIVKAVKFPNGDPYLVTGTTMIPKKFRIKKGNK